MLLDAPALRLQVDTNTALGILEGILKERHWKQFNVSSATLVYTPFWFFNFDVYEEAEGRAQTYSSQMCMNGLTGALEPVFIEIMKEIPTVEEKEITHSIQNEIKRLVIQKDEVKSLAQIKIAGQMGVQKDIITVSGVRLVYMPLWVFWVEVGRRTKRIDMDAISGSPLNIQDVPTRERGTMEVTMDMLEDLKRPENWVDYSKRAFDWSLGIAGLAGRAAGSGGGGVINWVMTTTMGKYAALLVFAAILVIYILSFK
ncbi:MAG: hypothetical protein JW834_02790 [Candidatus Diapherotrites archaeon]|nr:hypothetical protein [Candidatus Diapherotrites archaeon]